MRLKSLDCLRGIATAFAVLHHWIFTFWDTFPRLELHSVSDVAIDFAYHAVAQGPSAVLIFFVLSDFVLTLPLREGKTYWLPSACRTRLLSRRALTVIADKHVPTVWNWTVLPSQPHIKSPQGVGHKQKLGVIRWA